MEQSDGEETVGNIFNLHSVEKKHCQMETEEEKRTAGSWEETRITKENRKRKRESDRRRNLQEWQLLFNTTSTKREKKRKDANTEKQVGYTPPAELLFRQIKPGGCLSVCICVFWCFCNHLCLWMHMCSFFLLWPACVLVQQALI